MLFLFDFNTIMQCADAVGAKAARTQLFGIYKVDGK